MGGIRKTRIGSMPTEPQAQGRAGPFEFDQRPFVIGNAEDGYCVVVIQFHAVPESRFVCLDRNHAALKCEADEFRGVFQSQLLENSGAVIVDGLAAAGEFDGNLHC